MTLDPAHDDILDSILRIYPDRKGGSLSIAETANYLHQVHCFGSGKPASLYEVFRRNVKALGIRVSPFPGSHKRVWVSDLADAMAKLRNPDQAAPRSQAKAKAGFDKHRLQLTQKTGPGANKGGVVPSPLFVMQGEILVANPEAWQPRPQAKIRLRPVRTEFVSELARTRYLRREARTAEFWDAVLAELEHLEALKRSVDRKARLEGMGMTVKGKPGRQYS